MSLTRGRELPIGARAGLLDPKHVKAIGSARWLYDWILWRVTSEQEGVGRVLGGSPVRCEEIAADLGVGLRTIYRWMNLLRGPYIRTRHVVVRGRHGLAIEVFKSKKFHPSQPSGTSRISTISTVSTANPAKIGSVNPARFGRANPARSGRSYKEDRKPFTESYGKSNYGFLEDLPERANPPKTSPPSPPAVENQNQNQKQIPPAFAEASAGARFPGQDGVRWNDNVTACARSRGDGDGAGSGGEHREESAVSRAGGAGDESALADDGNSSREGADLGGRDGELLAGLRRMMGAKALPSEGVVKRRELLERQKCALLRRGERQWLPP
ncbi:MAG TPA: hypothetical protein VNJ52_13615 [Patescibacteria group bacterium]|nr:hypothetical protein [Patescibacteria group bacterium]